MKNIEIKKLPKKYSKLLYDKRGSILENFSLDDFISSHNVIVVDNSVYYNPNMAFVYEKLEMLNNNGLTGALGMMIPDVVIKNGTIIKNRYGSL